MWLCDKGHKNSNSSEHCHSSGCNEVQPVDVMIRYQNKKAKGERQKDMMSKRISGERMTRSVMKLFGGMK